MINKEELTEELFGAVCAEEEVADYYDDVEGAMEFAVKITIESLELRGMLKLNKE